MEGSAIPGWRAQEDRPGHAGGKRKSGRDGPDPQFVRALAADPQCAADHLPRLRPRIALPVPGSLSGPCQTFSRPLNSEGDFVIVHGRFSGDGHGPRNWIAADVVRIADDVLTEHWDVLQDEATRAESKSGLAMFCANFRDLGAAGCEWTGVP